MKRLLTLIAMLLPLSTYALDFITDFEWLEPNNKVEIVIGEPYQLKFSCSDNSLVFTSAYADSWVHIDFAGGQHVVNTPTGYSIDENGVISGIAAGSYAVHPTGWVQAKSGVDKWLYITVVPEINLNNNIIFADANVKSICVANWDTNHDGELSGAEAAAVTDLGGAFQGNMLISSFDELQHFTGLTSICSSAFSDCRNLNSVNIPNNVISIGKEAFERCSSLPSVTIPNSVTSIGDNAFSKCSSLTSISIPNSVTNIGKGAFYRCAGLVYVIIGDGVTSIEKDTFLDCSGLISVTIGYSVTSIGDEAFHGCSSLTSITIPNSVISIGAVAFYGCSGLTSITIPNSVTSFGDFVFYGCSGLTSVTIPNSVTNISNCAFSGCSGLTSLTIPNSVTSIGSCAFEGCSSLISITIPNNVSKIEGYAFKNCSGLTSITIPNSVSSIGASAFENCSKMETLKLPDELQIIKKATFKGCNSLKSITIPSTVEFIYQEAFANCNALESVKALPEAPPFLYDNSFSNYNIPLYAPENAIETYKATSPWSKFAQFLTLDGSEIIVDPKQCATPTISYKNGQLSFECETEDVEFKSSIRDTDINDYSASVINLSATYTITVYATKAGYENSEVATGTLCWIDVAPQTEGIVDEDAVMEVKAMPVLIQSQGGTISIQGAAEGTPIAVYDTEGKQYGSTIAEKDRATITTSLRSGSIAIVKIGEKAVKVAIK